METTFKSISGGKEATDDASESECNDAYCAVYHPHQSGRQSHAPLVDRVEKKWAYELDKLGLGEAVEEDKQYCYPRAFFRKKVRMLRLNAVSMPEAEVFSVTGLSRSLLGIMAAW